MAPVVGARGRSGPSLATRLTVAFSSLAPGGGATRAVVVAPALHCGWLRNWATDRGLSVVGETDDQERVHILIAQCKANAVIVGPISDQRLAVAWIAGLRSRVGDIEIVVPDFSPLNGPVDALTAAAAQAHQNVARFGRHRDGLPASVRAGNRRGVWHRGAVAVS